MSPAPSTREIKKVAQGMFSIADVSGKGVEAGISSVEFVRWATHHVIGQTIMDSVDKVRRPMARARTLCCHEP